MKSPSQHRVLPRTTLAAEIAATLTGNAALAIPNGWTSYIQSGPPPVDPPVLCFYQPLYKYPGVCAYVEYEVWQRPDCTLELLCRTSKPLICPCVPPGQGWRPFHSAATFTYDPINFPAVKFDWQPSDFGTILTAIAPITISSVSVFNLETGAGVAVFAGAEGGSIVSVPTAELADETPYAIVGFTANGRMHGYSAFTLKGAPREVASIAFDVVWSDGDIGTPATQMVAFTSSSQAGIVSQFSDLSVLTEVTSHNAFACAGDFNADSLVDDMDFLSFIPSYEALVCEVPGEGCPADLTGDGYVDDADFGIFIRAYNQLLCP